MDKKSKYDIAREVVQANPGARAKDVISSIMEAAGINQRHASTYLYKIRGEMKAGTTEKPAKKEKAVKAEAPKANLIEEAREARNAARRAKRAELKAKKEAEAQQAEAPAVEVEEAEAVA